MTRYMYKTRCSGSLTLFVLRVCTQRYRNHHTEADRRRSVHYHFQYYVFVPMSKRFQHMPFLVLQLKDAEISTHETVGNKHSQFFFPSTCLFQVLSSSIPVPLCVSTELLPTAFLLQQNKHLSYNMNLIQLSFCFGLICVHVHAWAQSMNIKYVIYQA